MSCNLCSMDLSKEKVFYRDNGFVVISTKDLKGHRDRMMIVSTTHVHDVTHQEYEKALDILDEIGRKVFEYAPKFVVMDSTFATIKEHWHLVATDLDPKSSDFDQILLTKWILMVDNINP